MDWLLISLVVGGIVIVSAIALLLPSMSADFTFNTDAHTDLILSVLPFIVLAVEGAYFVIGLHVYGRTLGGALVGIRCVDNNGNWPSWRAASVRFAVVAGFVLFQQIPIIGLLGLIGLIVNYLWMLWDPQKQCLMDKAANTYVVNAHSLPRKVDTMNVNPADNPG